MRDLRYFPAQSEQAPGRLKTVELSEMQDQKITDISISQLRKDAFAVSVGYAGLTNLPMGLVVGAAIVSSSMVVALGCILFAALVFAALAAYARSYTARSLRILVAVVALFLTVEVGLVAFGAMELSREISRELRLQDALIFLVVLIPLSAIAYWIQVRPAIAAMRLLGARVPPSGQQFTALMEPFRTAPVQPAPGRDRRPSAVLHQLFGVILMGVLMGVPAVGEFWWLLFGDFQSAVFAFPVVIGALLLGAFLYRRGLRLAALSAEETLRNDTRPPILYLRSFMDDTEVTAELHVGRGGRDQPVGHSLVSRRRRLAGGRLEEVLAKSVKHLGPFVAIGNPSERLPEIGAARAYHTNDTWQNAIKQWVDAAQLIIQVAGPTTWIRWELDTILARSAGSKLILLFPPTPRGDHGLRWDNISGALQFTSWGTAFARLDSEVTLALRLLPDGNVCAVSSRRHDIVDYTLAIRILLGATKQAQADLT